MTRREPDMTGPGHSRRLIRDPVSETLIITFVAEDSRENWRAWQSRLLAEHRERWPAGLTPWFIHAPGAHPLWQWHMIGGCHLRPLPGEAPPMIRREGASHEIHIAALNPDWDPIVDPTTDEERSGPHLLRPLNMVHQVVGLTDEQAAELVHLLARAIVNGIANPDDDFATANMELLDGTAAHLRDGRHMPS